MRAKRYWRGAIVATAAVALAVAGWTTLRRELVVMSIRFVPKGPTFAHKHARPSDIPALRRLFSHERGLVAWEACCIVGRLGGPTAFESLRELTLDERQAPRRRYGAGLYAMRYIQDDSRVEPFLHDLLASEDRLAVLWAVRVLSHRGEIARHEPRVLEVVDRGWEQEEWRHASAEALRAWTEAVGARATTRLTTAMAHADPEVQWDGLYAARRLCAQDRYLLTANQKEQLGGAARRLLSHPQAGAQALAEEIVAACEPDPPVARE